MMKNKWYSIGFVVAAVMSLQPLPAFAGEWNFERLMSLLGEHSRWQADFVELRSSIFLSRPLEVTGVISFDAKEQLEKKIETPFKEHFVIDDEFVVIHRTNTTGQEELTSTITYSLEKYPFLAKAINGVSNVFAGDRALLDELYNTTLEGTEENWQLKLEPKHEKLAEFIDWINVQGSGGLITRIHTLEADGDESDMMLTPTTAAD